MLMGISQLRSVIALVAFLVYGIFNTYAANASDMTVTQDCLASSCYLILSGKITTNTLVQLKEKGENLEGNLVILESPGGNLKAALEIGRYLRKNNFRTRVGRLFETTSKEAYTNKCLSACAYAFLGGISREVDTNAQIGFHRFSFGPQGQTLIPVDSALSAAQDISSDLIAYILLMDVDARIFIEASKASSNKMQFPDRKTLLEYAIVTPGKFSVLYLEPYGSGVVAASKRLHRPHQFANLDQLTAFCRRRSSYLLFSTSISTLASEQSRPLHIQIIGTQTRKITIPSTQIRLKATKSGTLIEVEISKDLANRISKASSISSEFEFSNAVGGQYGFKLKLSDKDRSFLEAAFRLCI